MSQFNWILLDDFGRQFKVGLYHGTKSGHVLVYCNLRIIIIDFNVRNSKTYSFFLGDEFCELSIKRNADHFEYHFKKNHKVDTPLNRIRRNQEKKHLYKLGLLILIAILTIFSIIYLFNQLG